MGSATPKLNEEETRGKGDMELARVHYKFSPLLHIKVV